MLPVGIPLLALAASSQDVDRFQAWAEDVEHLVAEIERLHPDPFFGCPRTEFERGVDTFLSRIGSDEEKNVVELMRLVALLAREGRDGHSLVWSFAFESLPLQLYGFDDGWFVVAADAPHGELVGARVTTVAGRPLDEVAAALAPLLTRDNEISLRAKLGGALATASLLRGVGIQRDAGPITLGFERDGREREIALAPVGGRRASDLPPPVGALPSARGRERSWWSEVLPRERALYVQYDIVAAADESGATLAAFAADLPALVERERLERVIVDVRWNGGGDNTTFGPLIDALHDPCIDRPGRLFALIGRHTFSAAGNFVAALDRDTGAVLVGEPTGGGPNQYGDARQVELPHHPDVLVRIVTRYHVFADADDPRLTNAPDVTVPLLSSDYFAGRDAALAHALRAPPR